MSGASQATKLLAWCEGGSRSAYRDGCERRPRLDLLAPLHRGFRFVAAACPKATVYTRDPTNPSLPESIPGRRGPLSVFGPSSSDPVRERSRRNTDAFARGLENVNA